MYILVIVVAVFAFIAVFRCLPNILSKLKNRKVLKNNRKVDDSDFLEIKQG